ALLPVCGADCIGAAVSVGLAARRRGAAFMRRVAGVAASVIAVLYGLCGVASAEMDLDDDEEPASSLWPGVEDFPSLPIFGGENPPHFLFYAGTDLWRYATSMHGGVLWSPAGINHEGFTLKLLIAGGRYKYQSGFTPVVGEQGLVSVLPGWRFKQERFETAVYFGLDIQNHQFSPDDPTNAL